jgi:hypothetical protein
MNITGNFTNSGTFTHNSGTVTFNGASSILGTSPIDFYNITISSGHSLLAPADTMRVAKDFVSNGTFTHNSGTVKFNGNSAISGNPLFNNITISGTLASPSNLQLGGDLTNNGTFNSGTGTTVTFSPGSGVTSNIAGSKKITFYNLTLLNNSAPTDLLLQSNAGAALTNVLSIGTATFDVNGKPFTLISTETCGATTSVPMTSDASIAAIGSGGAILGNVTVQRFMCREGILSYYYHVWRDISPPVNSATVHDLQQSIPVTWPNRTYASTVPNVSGNPNNVDYNVSSIQVFTESTNGWSDFLTADSTDAVKFRRGQGYSVFIFGQDSENANGNNLWSLTGPINKGPVSLPVSFTSTAKGWNFVGNPFASTIDWDKIRGISGTSGFHSNTGGSYTNIQPTIYIENFSKGSGMVYSTYNSVNPGASTNQGSQFIATGQGFFVRSSGASPTLTIFETAKAAGTQTRFFREKAPSNILRITLASSEKQLDETVISLVENSTDEFDEEYDAVKLDNRGHLNLSSLSPSQEKYAINSIPFPVGQKRIPLDISQVITGSHTLSFTEISSFPTSLRVQLEDKFENTVVDIRKNPDYSFNVNKDNAGTFGSGRFNVVLGGEEIKPGKRINVYPIPVTGMLTIEAEGEETASGEVINMVGLNIGTITFSNDGKNQVGKFDFSNENSGMYFIRVKRNDQVSVVRIVRD